VYANIFPTSAENREHSLSPFPSPIGRLPVYHREPAPSLSLPFVGFFFAFYRALFTPLPSLPPSLPSLFLSLSSGIYERKRVREKRRKARVGNRGVFASSFFLSLKIELRLIPARVFLSASSLCSRRVSGCTRSRRQARWFSLRRYPPCTLRAVNFDNNSSAGISELLSWRNRETGTGPITDRYTFSTELWADSQKQVRFILSVYLVFSSAIFYDDT